MELRQLEHYIAVATEMNFSRAAERTQVTQSALSSSIRKLETELDVRLIDRTRRQIEITAAGRVFLHRAREAVAAAHRARGSVDDFRDQLTGNVNFGLMMTCGVLDLPGALAEYRDTHPLVTMRLLHSGQGSTGHFKAIVDGKIDVALVSISSPQPELVISHELAREPMLFVCHSTHDLAGRETVTLEEVADYELIHFPPGWGIRRRLEDSFASAALRPTIPYEVANYELAAELARRRLAATIIPATVAERFPDLSAVALQPAIDWTLSVAFAGPEPNRQAVVSLIDTLGRHLP